jgi:hypothetical protein
MRTCTGRAAAVLPMALLLCAAGAQAQNAGSIVGRVLEFASDSAVAEVRLELLDARDRSVATTTSDAAGAFQFRAVRAGAYRIRAGAIGYRQVTTPAVQVGDETVHVIVRLGIDAVPLAPLEVVGRPAALHANLGVSEFMERAQRNMGGTFIMRDDIEARQPMHVSDMLQTVGSMTVVNRARGGVIHNARTQCPPAVYVDGVELFPRRTGGYTNSYDAVNSVHWSEVQGMEVYVGAATLPARFSGARSGCGVIAIWTIR